MAATLIKIDRNGSKHYHGLIPCDRCGGQGGSAAWQWSGWTCYKCGGTGMVEATWIERTPEYEAKLAAKRAAKAAARAAEYEEQHKEWEAARIAKEEAEKREEARIKAQKAISQYIGQVGEKINTKAMFVKTAYYDFKMGWMEQRMYIHTFKDPDGNILVWKTSSNSLSSLDLHYGEPVDIIGTVKEHSEYQDEKQTVLTRCKITRP